MNDAPPPPPPPPPHGTNPRPPGSGGLPDGNYDIFIIPPHSAGGGFLYLPSLQPHRNSFLAGIATALAAVGIYTVVMPVLKTWFATVMAGNAFGVLVLVAFVGLGAWAFGKTSAEGSARHEPGEGGSAGRNGASGAGQQRQQQYGGQSYGGMPNGYAPPPQQPPPPQPGAQAGGQGHTHSAPPPEPQPQPQPQPQPPPPKPASNAQSGWEKAREETRKREEERRRAEEWKKKREEAQKAREDAERAARAAAEKEKWEQARAREKDQREREARERIARERLEKEKAEREAKDKTSSQAAEKERLERAATARERLEKLRADRLEREKAAAAKAASAPSAAGGHASPGKKYERPTARSQAGTEDAYSYRPYDTASAPATKTRPAYKSSASSISGLSESSYAPSQSTARTTPPPSMRGPYSTNDPDKIQIRGVYLFSDSFPTKPISQLVANEGTVTDGLVLHIKTEGLFIDDDIRKVPQREWDVKAWTLKLVEDGALKSSVAGGAGLHVFRATTRDAENKKYTFVLEEKEGWKVAIGLQRLRKGSQVRSLGMNGMQERELRGLLGSLGWL